VSLPPWDFGSDHERGAFVAWVNAELDRFDGLVTGRFNHRSATEASVADLLSLPAAKATAGRPTETDAHRERAGQNAALRDAALLRWMFKRYWPGRNRPMEDCANAFRIASARHQRALPLNLRTAGRQDAQAERELRAAHALKRAYDRSTDTPGRRVATDDLAHLATLPGYLFADHYTGDKKSG
jgi:hypothetical protein